MTIHEHIIEALGAIAFFSFLTWAMIEWLIY